MSRNLLLGASALTLAAGAAFIPDAHAADVYFQGATAPTGAVWVPDGTGQAGGHLWISDHIRGFCRLNPVNSENVAATLNASGCIVADGQPSYNEYPTAKAAFIPDGSAKSVGIIRVQLNNATKLFTGARTTLNPALPAAFPDKRCKNNNLAGCRPIAAVLAPNGTDLYISTQRSRGTIYRIRNVSRGLSGIAGSPGALQVIGTTEDGGSAQSMAFVGPDLYLAEGTTVTMIPDPSNLVADGNPLCNNNSCLASTVGFEGSIPGVLIAPLSVGSDGTHLFVGDFNEVNVFDPAADILPITTISGPQAFRNISGFGISTPTAQSPDARIFWGDDPSAGASVLLGTWYTQKLVDTVTPQ